jgi:orotate phosphoribosyltransferase
MIEKEIGNFDFQLAGLETASTPMLVSIPLVAKTHGININAFSVRKNRKEYGLHNWIEGPIISDLPVLLVDDLCNSSNSMQKAMYTIYGDQKLEFMKYAVTIVNKNVDVFANCKTMPKDMKMLSLFSLSDFDLTWTKSSITN